ncbi:DUF6314 family protein [Psychromicrobium sp. YIM B11713]|uniref:DUF6314 family protein n=1 Tax=Psychromicrobium sp. YIM B11713 TaxID=3145233 RepID=UPI00374E956C
MPPSSSPQVVPAAAQQPVAISNLAAFLLGSWRIERTLLERSTGQRGEFQGDLEFSSSHSGLHYRESGTLRWDAPQEVGSAPRDHRVPVKRDYLLRATPDPRVLDWYFDYGDYFHQLDLSSGRWQTEHPCSADLYRVDYTVLDAEHLRVIWEVAGPHKDQLISSSWSRLSASP